MSRPAQDGPHWATIYHGCVSEKEFYRVREPDGTHHLYTTKAGAIRKARQAGVSTIKVIVFSMKETAMKVEDL